MSFTYTGSVPNMRDLPAPPIGQQYVVTEATGPCAMVVLRPVSGGPGQLIGLVYTTDVRR